MHSSRSQCETQSHSTNTNKHGHVKGGVKKKKRRKIHANGQEGGNETYENAVGINVEDDLELLRASVHEEADAYQSSLFQ